MRCLWRWAAALAVATLPSCGGDYLGNWDFCGDPVPCDSREYGLTALGPSDALEVGRLLQLSASIKTPCSQSCASDVAAVDWRASAPGIVDIAGTDRPLSAVVFALAPGQVEITAEITFKSGARQPARTASYSNSPLLITVVPATEG